MRRLASVAILSVLAAVPVAAQPLAVRIQLDPSTDSAQSEKLAAPIEQCIRDNAAKVEIAVDDLGRAVTFLVSDVCAEPIAAENARRTKLAAAARTKQFQAMCDEQKKHPPKEKAAFDICAISNFPRVGFTGIDQVNSDNEDDVPAYTGAGSPAITALASRLLLDLRLARIKAKP